MVGGLPGIRVCHPTGTLHSHTGMCFCSRVSAPRSSHDETSIIESSTVCGANLQIDEMIPRNQTTSKNAVTSGIVHCHHVLDALLLPQLHVKLVLTLALPQRIEVSHRSECDLDVRRSNDPLVSSSSHPPLHL